jgi:hypothetical protein
LLPCWSRTVKPIESVRKPKIYLFSFSIVELFKEGA